MNTPYIRIEPLSKTHNRSAFRCTSPALTRYLKEQVSQDMKRNVTACFVALLESDASVVGYYTLAASSLSISDLPGVLTKKLPRYPSLPAVLMGRLAIDDSYTGQGLGTALLADALRRSCRSEIAAYALVVDAESTAAAAFYARHSFQSLPDSPLKLFLPLASCAA